MRASISPNPVLVKELRGRMRGPRAYLLLSAALAVLALATYGLYRLSIATMHIMSGGIPQGALIGRAVFTGLAFMALLVTAMSAPFLTAGAISGEWERKTFDLLLATPLRPSAVLLGKLLAALSYIALMLLAAIPLASLSFVFGGVATQDMLKALLLLLGFAVSFSVMGLFFSALIRRTGVALAASYSLLGLSILGPTFASVFNSAMGRQPPSWLLAANPFAAMASLLTVTGSPFPLGGLPGAIGTLLGTAWQSGPMVTRPGSVVLISPAPLWQQSAGLYAWLTVAMYLASTQLVRPIRRFRLSARAWAVVGGLFVVAAIAAPVVYGPFTPGRLLAWVRWLRSSPHNLVSDGTFAAPLDKAWTVYDGATIGGEVGQVSADGRQVVRLARKAEAPGEISITQPISQAMPADGWLQVRAILRVQSQDAPLCGDQGDRCPLTLKLYYDDAAGLSHEWTQGFYSLPGPQVPFCNTCETRQAHIQVMPGSWYTYESPNLLEIGGPSTMDVKGMPLVLPPPPRTIHSLTVVAAGTSFEAEVAEVALISREGQPLNWGGGTRGTPTPAPVPLPMRVAPLSAPAMGPMVPAPTPTPETPGESPPTPVPTSAPSRD